MRVGSWRAWTNADAGLDASRLERYAEGFGHGAGTDEDAVGAISAEMGRSGASWLIAHPYARPSDPFLDRGEMPHTAVGGAVYYVGNVASEEPIAVAWRRAKSDPATIGIVTDVHVAAQELTVETLGRAASGVCLMVLRAYDGEGVILYEVLRPGG